MSHKNSQVGTNFYHPCMRESLLGDLTILLENDRAAYLSLGPIQAVFSVKSPGYFAFGEAIDRRWARLSPRERAETVIACIQRAAAYWRSPHRRYFDPSETEAFAEEVA